MLTRYFLLVGIGAFGFAVGCAGTLDDPDRFRPDAEAAPVATATPAPAASCGDVEVSIVRLRCSSCHGATGGTAGLDLETPGVLARLADKRTVDGTARLVVKGNAESSALFTKLGKTPPFGSRMPTGTPLSDSDIACVKAWIDAAQ